MIFHKKIKVYWINLVGFILLSLIFHFPSIGQCGSIPSKLVYISKDNFDVNATNLKDTRLPVGNSTSITWEYPADFKDYFDFSDEEKPMILLSKLNFFDKEPQEFTLKGTCGTENVSIQLYFLPAVHPRNAITVNGVNDGKNDVWNIMNLEKYENPTVKVVNRWGNVVFESKNIYKVSTDKNDSNPFKYVFTGRDEQGNRLATGAYVYSIIPHPEYPEILGQLSIIR